MKYLVAIDFSEDSRWALDAVLRHARTGDQILVISIASPPKHLVPAFSAAEAIGGDPLFRDLEDYTDAEAKSRDVQDRLKLFLAETKVPEGLTLLPLVRIGDPKTEIITASEELKVDHIYMGSRGLGVIAKFFLGSVSDHVMRNSRCSVTIVRKPTSEANK